MGSKKTRMIRQFSFSVKKSGLWSSSVRKCFHKIAKFAGNCVPPKLSACVSSAKLRKCIVVLAYLARDFKGKSTSLRNVLELLSFKNEQKKFWNSRLTMIILWTTEIRKIEINFGKRVYCAADGDRTPAACVTGLYTYHYTTGPSY